MKRKLGKMEPPQGSFTLLQNLIRRHLKQDIQCLSNFLNEYNCTSFFIHYEDGCRHCRFEEILVYASKNSVECFKMLTKVTFLTSQICKDYMFVEAIGCCNFKCAALLLNYGANVDCTYHGKYIDNSWYTSHCSISLQPTMLRASCDKFNEAKTVKWLLEHGANIHKLDWRQMTALRVNNSYCDPKCLKLLIEYGADINACNDKIYGTTVLIDTIQYKHLEYCQLLLEYGADVNIRDYRGRTPLIT